MRSMLLVCMVSFYSYGDDHEWFDIPTMCFDDFYQDVIFVPSFVVTACSITMGKYNSIICLVRLGVGSSGPLCSFATPRIQTMSCLDFARHVHLCVEWT